jgi:uncharacterized membrane protein
VRRVVARIARASAFIALVASPFAIHWALLDPERTGLAAGLVIAQVGLVGEILLRRATFRYKWFVGAAGLALLAAAFWHFGRQSLVASTGLPHALAYLTLIGLFGSSLLPGRQPLISVLARKVRGPLNDELVAYTRHVTEAWCLFCAAQLLTSLALYLWAPLATWSLFINVLNMPLIALMFGAEYLYRKLRFRTHPNEGLTDVFRIFSQGQGVAAKHAD